MHVRGLQFLLAACALFLSALPLHADPVLVKAETLSLREKPDTKSKRLETLTNYDLVEIKNRQGDWAQVQSKAGKVGWVLGSYLHTNAYVSVDNDTLNVRRGPGTNYSIVMRVSRHYPFRVVDRSEDWLLVSDFDGDKGWVSKKLVSFTPYVITRLDKCNIRQGPGTESKIAFTAERGVLFRVLNERDGWLNIKHNDGDEGWISAKIVFGWLEGDTVDATGS
jgi:SH3-like domain-containing protein